MGCNGCCSDAQTFECQLKQSLLYGTTGFPDADPLPGDMPYFIVADDSCALRTWLMKPFSIKNFHDQ